MPKDIIPKDNFQSPVPTESLRLELNNSSNSVKDSIPKYQSNYLSGNFGIPEIQRIEGGYSDRHSYFSGEDNKKYQIGSEHETKPHTQRTDGHGTGL